MSSRQFPFIYIAGFCLQSRELFPFFYIYGWTEAFVYHNVPNTYDAEKYSIPLMRQKRTTQNTLQV